jgi:hypothetical protein
MARKTESLIRLSVEAKDMLKTLAVLLNLSQSQVVETLIIQAAKANIAQLEKK